MRPATPELDALLASGVFVYANCFEILLRDGLGTMIRMTDHDVDITIAGETFTHAIIRGARLRVVRGLEVDEQTLEWTPTADATLRGRPIKELVRKGLFDRAWVVQRRMFAPDWASPITGWITPFAGEVVEADYLGGKITLNVDSLLVLLNVNVPGPVYQAGCRHIFGSPSCGVDLAALAVPGVAMAGSTAAVVLCGLTDAAHAWDHGQVTMTSGVNTGLSRSVKTSMPGRLDLYGPFPYPAAPGDTFSIVSGCDKTLDRCTQYANRDRFGGQPWVPVPETGT